MSKGGNQRLKTPQFSNNGKSPQVPKGAARELSSIKQLRSDLENYKKMIKEYTFPGSKRK